MSGLHERVTYDLYACLKPRHFTDQEVIFLACPATCCALFSDYWLAGQSVKALSFDVLGTVTHGQPEYCGYA
jgi:hypothetical protein